MITMMISCRELYSFLDEFLDGRLTGAVRLKFEGHLLLCAECRRYLRSYRTTVRVAREAELLDAPAGASVPEDLIQAILLSRTSVAGPPVV